MSVIRAFIAIDLTPEIRQRMDQVVGQLKSQLEGVPVRWVPAGNIHLTLKFLGDVSQTNLEILQNILQAEVGNYHPFEISVGGLGAFPGIRHPRVVWIGVEAPPDLLNLQRSVETAMARLGYAREDRPFSAHLTLGRVSRNATARDTHAIGEALEKTKVGFLGVAQVNFIHLYRSDLKPSGAVYSRIYSTPLKN
jgi:2'-5' RNA ligase